MSPKKALARIKVLVGKGFYGFTEHCDSGMEAHDIRPAEVLRIVAEAKAVSLQDNGRWRIDGTVDREAPVRVVIEADLSKEVVFVTVHLILSSDES